MEICIWQGFAVKQMKWKTSVLLRIAAFFQTTESCLEMKAIKKKTYWNLDLCNLCFCRSSKGRSDVFTREDVFSTCTVRQLFTVFTDVTYRWHRWSRCLVQSSYNHSVCILVYCNISSRKQCSIALFFFLQSLCTLAKIWIHVIYKFF